MPDFEKSGGIIVIVGVAVAALGGASGVNRLSLLGMIILGVGIISWGLSGLFEKRILFFHPGMRRSESYYGVAARAWGALLCLGGLGVVGFSVILFFTPDIAFEQVLVRLLGGGKGMVLGGLVAMLYSVTLIIGRAETRAGLGILSLPRKILGIIVLMTAIILVAAGMTSIISPQFYERVIQSISDMLPRPPQLNS